MPSGDEDRSTEAKDSDDLTAASSLEDAAVVRARDASRRRVFVLAGGVGAVAVAVALVVGLSAGTSQSSLASRVIAVVNLRTSDLPGRGWHVQIPGGVSEVNRQAEAQFTRCFGSYMSSLGRAVASPTYVVGTGAGTNTAVSNVAVVASGPLLARDLAAADSPRLPGCEAQLWAATEHVTYGAPGSATDTNVHFTLLPVAAPGADAALGLLATSTFKLRGYATTLRAYEYLLSFGVGRVFVELSVNTFDRPASAAAVERVYERLIARARAHQP